MEDLTKDLKSTTVSVVSTVAQESFSEHFFKDCPFIFDGTPDEQAKFKSIYLDFIQTPEGKRNVDLLKASGHQVKLGMEPLEGAYGTYDLYTNEIKLDSNDTRSLDDVCRTLRHETDHALQALLPSVQNAKSMGERFYIDKMKEVQTKVNDAAMAHRQGKDAGFVSFYTEKIQQARDTLPDTPDKEQQVERFAKAALAKALWSGGEGVSDRETLLNILVWNKTYNNQAYQTTLSGSVYSVRYEKATQEEFHNGVRQAAKEMDFPVDGDFLIKHPFFETGAYSGINVSENSLYFKDPEKKTAQYVMVTEKGIQSLKRDEQKTRMQEYQYKEEQHPDEDVSELVLSSETKSYGLKETTYFVDAHKSIQQTILPTGEELPPLINQDGRPMNGAKLIRYSNNDAFEYDLYKDGSPIQSMAAIELGDKKRIIVNREELYMSFTKDDTSISMTTQQKGGELVKTTLLTMPDVSQMTDEPKKQAIQEAYQKCAEAKWKEVRALCIGGLSVQQPTQTQVQAPQRPIAADYVQTPQRSGIKTTLQTAQQASVPSSQIPTTTSNRRTPSGQAPLPPSVTQGGGR